MRLLLTTAFAFLLSTNFAVAAPTTAQDMGMQRRSPTPPAYVAPQPAPKIVDPYRLPDQLAFSIGYFDALDNSPRQEAVDFRLEHRWGVSLLPKISDYFTSWNPYFQLRPMAGAHVTSDGAMYGFGGFAGDFLIGRNFVLTWSEAVGLYYRGEGKRLGSVVEFRSQIEAGYRFDNEVRLTVALSHISNAGLTDLNPGVNMISGYIHVPTSWVFGD